MVQWAPEGGHAHQDTVANKHAHTIFAAPDGSLNEVDGQRTGCASVDISGRECSQQMMTRTQIWTSPSGRR